MLLRKNPFIFSILLLQFEDPLLPCSRLDLEDQAEQIDPRLFVHLFCLMTYWPTDKTKHIGCDKAGIVTRAVLGIFLLLSKTKTVLTQDSAFTLPSIQSSFFRLLKSHVLQKLNTALNSIHSKIKVKSKCKEKIVSQYLLTGNLQSKAFLVVFLTLSLLIF